MSELDLPQARYLPWQQSQRDRLQLQINSGRLPHALLLSGIAHIGKKNFAFALGTQLLCTSPVEGNGCGRCASCHLVNAGTHPDLKVVRPLESKLIVIEQIRNLTQWATQTAQQGADKLAILYPAEQMNVQSANALLKCLEEPVPDTYFILVTDQPGRLLATIRSRCQGVQFQVPEAADAIAWLRSNADEMADIPLLLALASGAPMKVVNQFDVAYLSRRTEIAAAIEQLILGKITAVAAAATLFYKEDPIEVYDVVYGLYADALKLTLSGSNKSIINKDMERVINIINRNINGSAMLLAVDCINICRRVISSSSNPSPQLLLESLLIRLARVE